MSLSTLSRFAAVVALTVCITSVLFAAPRIQFEKESLDFGSVVGGKPVDAVFRFTNVGDSELEVTGVRSGCGCTHAEAKQRKVAPGGSSTIEATFNSTGYNGLISKSITITTNDPAHPTVVLSIKAQIVRLAKFKPERLNFGSVKVNESRIHSLLVMPGDPKSFVITKIEPQGAHVAVPEFKKITAATGDFWELLVVVKAGSSPGRVMESINILTNAGTSAKLSVLVYGNVVE